MRYTIWWEDYEGVWGEDDYIDFADATAYFEDNAYPGCGAFMELREYAEDGDYTVLRDCDKNSGEVIYA